MYLQTTASKTLVVDTPIAKTGTNLSKLRVVHPNHSRTKQTVLSYGQPVHLMHNAYVNGINLPLFIKYGDHLQSHQEGASYHTYMIYNADDRNKQGPVEPGVDVYICGDKDNSYLRVEADKTVTSTSPADSATRFKVTLRRVFEAHNQNLCVCSNENLYT